MLLLLFTGDGGGSPPAPDPVVRVRTGAVEIRSFDRPEVRARTRNEVRARSRVIIRTLR